MTSSPDERAQPGRAVPGVDGGSDQAHPSLVVFDIDGVLADVRHRLHHVTHRPKNWRKFFGAAPQDPPLPDGVAAVAAAQRAGHGIVYLTGRPEWCRADTVDWLARHGLPDAPLYMRDNHDRRPARFTKIWRLEQLARRHRIVMFVDDDAAVVEAVREAGFEVLHALWMGSETDGGAPGSGPTAQEVLFEIQERDPHT